MKGGLECVDTPHYTIRLKNMIFPPFNKSEEHESIQVEPKLDHATQGQ